MPTATAQPLTLLLANKPKAIRKTGDASKRKALTT